ncbi:MlaD family protein [Nocardia sp. NBC_00565]|uniref:MlaD family protein n=1 Tax=Nocardia sp. NBC_00565 TaxID=2975993 RepID=UPI002E81E2CE|nr:MlaD family protein [Nocardia sp. NBC_00565]WUC01922.1 MlaD family protein [Nocardia sp. NBC_00565]
MSGMRMRITRLSGATANAAITRLARHRLIVSLVALGLTLIFGASYLTLGSLQFNPFDATYTLRIHLAQSGGLLSGRDVTVRGVRVGRVTSVDLGDGDVVAVASIEASQRIPADSAVRVAGLSAAGEQYLDFVPTGSTGPYLADGAVIGANRTSTPIAMAQMLADLNGTIAQLDPDKLHSIVQELGAGPQAPDKLAAIINGGTFLVTTLSSVLPQTISLLHNSEIVLGTVRDLGPGLRSSAAELDRTLTGVESMSGGFVNAVGIAPAALDAMDQIIADNSPTMVHLLGNLATVAQMSSLRVPAMRELFFPQQREGSAADAVASAVHDGKIWALVSIYPRKQCDYNVPRFPATDPSYPEPYRYVDCSDPDPSLLPRGARNAPRPPGDNASYPPPGADPLATTDPTPQGRLTIPTPYGGVPAPVYVPPN